jgi:predicted GH43/DUF377 family glycosyl hydrolase
VKNDCFDGAFPSAATERSGEDGSCGKERYVRRRDFIASALQLAVAASMTASAGEVARTESTEPHDDTSAEAKTPAWILDQIKRSRPPFRIGFHRILDPSQGEKEAWYINDHCFVQADNGTWHVFGITAPEPLKPDKEVFLLHATAPEVLGPWTKTAPVMHVDARLGETVMWAPYVLKHDGSYWMFYCAGGQHHEQFRIHLATSTDLSSWTRHPANPMVVDGYDARDPMVLRVGSQWVLYYCANETPEGGNHIVAAVTSPDLAHWSGRQVVFRSPQLGASGGPTESPFVVARNGKYYLFVCTNDPYNNTAVYISDSPFHWSPDNLVLTFGAHAAEVIRVSEDRWFVSSAGWAQGGLYLAAMNWDEPGGTS